MIDTVIFCSFICCGTHCSSCFHMPNFLVHCLLQMFSRNRRELERAECISAEKGRLNDCVPWSHLPRTMFRWLFSSLYTNSVRKKDWRTSTRPSLCLLQTNLAEHAYTSGSYTLKVPQSDQLPHGIVDPALSVYAVILCRYKMLGYQLLFTDKQA